MSNPAECAPETPWGIHQEVVDNACPRCGWCANGQAAAAPLQGQSQVSQVQLAA